MTRTCSGPRKISTARRAHVWLLSLFLLAAAGCGQVAWTAGVTVQYDPRPSHSHAAPDPELIP